MPDRPTDLGPLNLQDVFPPVSDAEWESVIRADLKGADYDKRLLWHTDEGVTLRPFYRAGDLAGLATQIESDAGAFPFTRGTGRSPSFDSTLPVDEQNAVRADLMHDAGATTVQELGFALAEGVERMAALTDRGTSAGDAASSITFVFAVGSAFFLEIAKLRAARLAWAQVATAFGVQDPATARMRQVVRTARANKSTYDPYTNLLRATTEALSACIGGCDALTVEAFGFDSHLATNVGRILVEESHVDAVADPAGGSYYVEVLTDLLARQAWAVLQDVERRGGYGALDAAGAIRDAIAQSRTAREEAMATRRRTLVGINNYPDLDALEPAVSPAPEGWRLATPYERLRTRMAAHVRATGRRPVVLLLTRGDARMRMARANFALNFFGCAGFAIVQKETLDETSADLVVLCSSDAEYLAFAQDICPRTSAPVIVAGNPKDQRDQLTAAGVQGFVHVQSNAITTLTEWLDRLEIGGKEAHAS